MIDTLLRRPPAVAEPPRVAAHDSSRDVADAALRRLALFMAFGVGAVLLFAVNDGVPKGFVTLTVGAIVAGASSMIGGLLGFLFGIPRALREERPTEKPTTTEGTARSLQPGQAPTASANTYQNNTNLEEISDWLTKILVGVGLTQIGDLPTRMGELSGYLAPSFGGSAAFAIGLCLYFVIGGFLFSYLWTRLYMLEALRGADRAALKAEVKTEMQQQVEHDAKALTLLRELKPTAAPPTMAELTELLGNASDETRNSIRIDAMALPPEQQVPIYETLQKLESNSINSDMLVRALMQLEKWVAAENELTRLIDKPVMPGFVPGYRRLRAICRMSLEEPSKVSPNPTPIVADLQAAARDSFELGQMQGDSRIDGWLKQNNVERSSVGL